jgi:guanylate kinase
MTTRGKLIVLSGPSGTGKSTVIDRLLEQMPGSLEVSTSVTTRPPRPDDVHAKRYIHKSEPQFQDARQQGTLLECAEVSGHWYGTPREPVERALAEGRSVLLEIDVQGGMAVKRLFPECIMIFLKAPSLDEYERRIRHRGTNSEQEIQRRLAAARRELELADQYNYQVVNDDLNRSVAEIRSILERSGGTVCA